MIDITLSSYGFGLLVSIFTELLKFFPWLGKNELTKSLTAVVLAVVGAWYSTGWVWDFDVFAGVLLFAFLNYKMLIQPLGKVSSIKTQA